MIKLQWLVISLTLFLAIAIPHFSFLHLLETIIQIIINTFKLLYGIPLFCFQVIQFWFHEVSDTTPTQHEEFDFVVVGGGTAGAVLAARLSEIENAKVLILEAGYHEHFFMDVPIINLFLHLFSLLNWMYKSDSSQEYCLGTENHQCPISTGKGLGGTSSINFMIADRGSKYDYNEWAKLTSDSTWSYPSMLKYFKKLENFDINEGEIDRTFHAYEGPVCIARPSYRSPLAEAIVKAGTELGLPPIDYNGRRRTGFSYIQTNQVNGERLSTNRAYLHPARKRKNLVVSLHSYVNKVLIDPVTKTAKGVEFVKHGKKREVVAKKEVILTAGAIATSKILMLSGIGPAEQLKQLDIDVIKDLPVGENLQDHVTYAGLIFLVNETAGIVIADFLKPSDPSLADYLTRRKGQFTTSGIEGVSYFNIDNVCPENDKPNAGFIFGGVSILSDSLFYKPFGITRFEYQKFFEKYVYHHAWQLWPMVVKPRSRGKVLLRTANPLDQPRVISNYFSHPEDIRVLIKTIRFGIKVSKTSAMQRYNSVFLNQPVPGCEDKIYDTDEYWECAIRTFTVSAWHQVGTCKMGRENDSTAVVNSQLQVKGIKGLRVADASIMPNIVSGDILIPTIAIAEKMADILKSHWKYVINA